MLQTTPSGKKRDNRKLMYSTFFLLQNNMPHSGRNKSMQFKKKNPNKVENKTENQTFTECWGAGKKKTFQFSLQRKVLQTSDLSLQTDHWCRANCKKNKINSMTKTIAWKKNNTTLFEHPQFSHFGKKNRILSASFPSSASIVAPFSGPSSQSEATMAPGGRSGSRWSNRRS